MDWKRCVAVLLAFLTVFSVYPAYAQDSQNVTCIRQFYHNWSDGVQDVAIQGENAYLACGSAGFRIVNMAQPNNITEAGNIYYEIAKTVAVQGAYAYVGCQHNGLCIIDITNPAIPIEVSRISNIYDVHAIRFYGLYAFICADNYGLFVVNMANPASPQIAAVMDTLGAVQNIEFNGNIAYVSTQYQGLYVIDFSDVLAPRILGRYVTSGGEFVNDAAVSGGFAFLASGWNGLEVVDLSTMLAVAEIDSLIYAFNIEIVGDYAYMTYGDPECPLAVINISNPFSPIISGIYYPPQDIVNFDIEGDIVYVADFQHGLRMVDIANPGNPHEVNAYSRFGHDFAVDVIGNNCFVREDYKIKAIDFSDPLQPVELGYYESDPPINDFEIVNNIALVVQHSERCLVSVDISDPNSPHQLGIYNTPNNDVHYYVATYSHFAYILENYGLRIIDISNPSNMSQAGYFEGNAAPSVLKIFGNYALYQRSDYRLTMLDLANPTSPSVIYEQNLDFHVRDAIVSGNYLYYINQRQMWIYDISNRSDWVLHSAVTIVDGPYDCLESISEFNGLVYLTSLLSGLLVYDVNNSSMPSLAGYYQTSGNSQGMAVVGSMAIVADYDNLGFYDCSMVTSIEGQNDTGLPQDVTLLSNYPNPFNGSTVISFEIPEQSPVNLSIVNINGQLVKTLTSDIFPSGAHSITWDGTDEQNRDVSSGAYFYSLDIAGAIEARKMVLLR